jgi:tetratricopeptide (TPR) repeat protein
MSDYLDDELVAGYDPQTLHEVYPDLAVVTARIATLGTRIAAVNDIIDELTARGELVILLRATGQLDEALEQGELARDRADLDGNRAQQHTARLRLAQVNQWRGEFAESNLAFTELLAAAQQFGPVIEAFTEHHAGLNDYDQGHYADATAHFERALKIRDELELFDDQREASRVALAAASKRLAES